MENEIEEQEKKTPGAKVLSKIAMVLSGVWIMALTLLKAFGLINIEITDIIYSAIAIVAVWTPTYLSVILDKLKDLKPGNKDE